MRTFWLILYYGFAAHLPKSTAPVMGEMARRLRHRCVSHLFASCGAYTCVENGAYFGSGKDFKVGTAVGIGRNFRSHNRIVTIHDALLMGEEVFFVGGGIPSQTQTKTLVRDLPRAKRLWKSRAMCGLVIGR